MGVVGASRRKGSTLSFTQNEVVVVLRDLRPEFCVFGGEHVINEGRIWSGDWEGSGISEALGERAGVLACWRAVAGFKGEALSSRRTRGDVEQSVSTSERAENSLHSWATSSVRAHRASG